jgi:hypothetical protein
MTRKRKKMKRDVVAAGVGPDCPRCAEPMEVSEHKAVGPKQLRQAVYYSRWYRCTNPRCRTREVMPPEFKVWNEPAPAPETDADRRLTAIEQQLGQE